MGPKRPQHGPKRGPGGPQEAPKRPPRGPQKAPKRPLRGPTCLHSPLADMFTRVRTSSHIQSHCSHMVTHAPHGNALPVPSSHRFMVLAVFAVQCNDFCTFQENKVCPLVKNSKNAPDCRTFLHVEALADLCPSLFLLCRAMSFAHYK